MKKWIFAISLLVFCGCKTTEDVAPKTISTVYRFETSVPDVWADEPSQTLKLTAEFRR